MRIVFGVIVPSSRDNCRNGKTGVLQDIIRISGYCHSLIVSTSGISRFRSFGTMRVPSSVLRYFCNKDVGKKDSKNKSMYSQDENRREIMSTQPLIVSSLNCDYYVPLNFLILSFFFFLFSNRPSDIYSGGLNVQLFGFTCVCKQNNED